MYGGGKKKGDFGNISNIYGREWDGEAAIHQ